MKLFSFLGASALAESCKRPDDFDNPSSKEHCIGAGGDCHIDETKWKWHEFQGYLKMPENNEVPVWTQEKFKFFNFPNFCENFENSKRRKNTATIWE